MTRDSHGATCGLATGTVHNAPWDDADAHDVDFPGVHPWPLHKSDQLEQAMQVEILFWQRVKFVRD